MITTTLPPRAPQLPWSNPTRMSATIATRPNTTEPIIKIVEVSNVAHSILEMGVVITTKEIIKAIIGMADIKTIEAEIITDRSMYATIKRTLTEVPQHQHLSSVINRLIMILASSFKQKFKLARLITHNKQQSTIRLWLNNNNILNMPPPTRKNMIRTTIAFNHQSIVRILFKYF